jgi:subtilisin family serine protease
MPLRVLNSSGQGPLWALLKAIKYATDNHAQIINMSLGTAANTHSLSDLVDYAEQHNVAVVASAGNANANVLQFPCANSKVVCVAATDQNDAKAGFSNYNSGVSISAPGVALYAPYLGTDYASWSGTSMSAPLVAGGLALVLASTPTATASQAIQEVLGTATNINTLNPNYVGELGSGRLDLYNALAN